MNEHIKYWIALRSINGIGNASVQSLLDRFLSPAAVFSASIQALSAIPGISKENAAAIVSFNDWDKILRQMDALDKTGVKIITCLDDFYPINLLNIYDRPVFLYVLGNLEKDDIPVAIVGSRRASAYGRYTTDRISRELALKGITIVSGMARGIDSCAHRGALAAKGRTIAVLGSGLDVIYPPENKNLFTDIAQNGAVVSEFPPGTQPLPYHFPARNRIISGLSYGVVVVEAGEKSGSLITARLAMEQGREVFAIPGTIDSASSRGTNSLIKQGAKLIDSIDDILEDILPQIERSSLQIKPQKQQIVPACIPRANAERNADSLSLIDQTILKTLSREKTHADDIISGTGLPPADVSSALIMLELRGIILQHTGQYYSLKQ
ncbi:MAG: DNA-protecting protein DprA [Deltaproteobacteria bacterium HGW-Deltaproteobacteria-6]|jgi:DNA processing protein|nr:MAG: DNA-protecting protein DprA [Deltaproteobacteria bacterium HGW-Deltaproteobacteria-6]